MPGVIGEAFIAIRPLTTGFGPELQTQVSGASVAAGRAGGKVINTEMTAASAITGKNIGKNVGKNLEASAATSGAAAGKTAGASFGKTMLVAMAAVGAFKFFKDTIKEAQEAEVQQLKLQAAYRNFPAIGNVTIGVFRKLNDEMMRKVKFDDEAFASAEATLAQFKLTGTQIKTIIPLVADYAVRTGKDLPEAATALGRAFLGNARALKTIGINFKATGDIQRDYITITSLLREKVGGFAEEEGKTFSGRLEIFKNQFKETQEAIGTTILPVLTTLFHVLGLVAEGFRAVPAPVLLAVASFGGFVLATNLINKFVVASKSALASLGFIATEAPAAAAAVGAGAVEMGAAATASTALTGAAGSAMIALNGEGIAAHTAALALQEEAIAATGAGTATGLLRGKFLGASITAAAVVGEMILLGRGLANARNEADKWVSTFISGLGSGADAVKRIKDQIAALEKEKTGRNIFVDIAQEFIHLGGLIGGPTRHDVINAEIKKLKENLKDMGIVADATAEAGVTAVTKLEDTWDATTTLNENLHKLVAQGMPQELADQLKTMGADGQQAADLLAKGTKENLDEFVKAWRDSLDNAGENVKMFAGMTAKEFADWSTKITGSMNFVSVSLGEIGSALDPKALAERLSAAQDGVSASTDKLRNAQQNLSSFYAQHKNKKLTRDDLVEQQHLIYEVSKATRDNRDAVKELSDAQRAAKDPASVILQTFSDQLTEMKKYHSAFDTLIKRNLPQDFLQQLADMGDSGKSVVIALAASNKKEFDAIVAKWREAGGFAPGISKDIAKAFNDQNPIYMDVVPRVDQRLLMVNARAAKNELIRELGNINVPTTTTTTANVNLDSSNVKLNSPSVSMTAGTVHFYANKPVPLTATGGYVPRGLMHIVGEAGPELRVERTGAEIITNQGLMELLRTIAQAISFARKQQALTVNVRLPKNDAVKMPTPQVRLAVVGPTMSVAAPKVSIPAAVSQPAPVNVHAPQVHLNSPNITISSSTIPKIAVSTSRITSQVHTATSQMHNVISQVRNTFAPIIRPTVPAQELLFRPNIKMPVTHAQIGTFARPGTIQIVGEAGPELRIERNGADIVTNQGLMELLRAIEQLLRATQLAQSPAGPTQENNFTVVEAVDPRVTALQIARTLGIKANR